MKITEKLNFANPKTYNMLSTPLSVEAFRLALKTKGLKATTQRVAVHQAMMALGHACADQVSEWIEEHTSASVSTASVYNILSQMALLGIYSHRYSPDSKMYFDVNTDNHVHIYDAEAGTFTDLDDPELVAMVETHIRHKRYRGYKAESVDIQIIARPTQRKKQ